MLYIVFISVDNDVHEDWYLWMRDVHVGDVLDTGCFYDAIVARDVDADTETRTAYRILYRAYSESAFRRYEAEHAPALKADHANRYAGRVEARRDILPIAAFRRAKDVGLADA